MDYKKIFADSVISKIEYKYSSATEHFDNIGYGIDNNYARCMGVSIVSLCENNPMRNFQFYVVASGLTEKNLLKIKQTAEKYNINIFIYNINVDEFKKFAVQEYFPTAMYFRMVLPTLNTDGKCLYIDADVICTGDIAELLDVDIIGYDAVAVRDYKVVAQKREQALSLPENTYFNTGVLMFNFTNWFNKSLVNKMADILLKYDTNLLYPDQDALNIIMSGNIRYMDSAYNRINVSREADGADKLKNTKLLHFTAHPKPWTVLWQYCGDNMLKGIYEKYEALSPWKDEPLQLPVHYKHKKWYANHLRQEGKYRAAFYWYYQYIYTKFKRISQ